MLESSIAFVSSEHKKLADDTEQKYRLARFDLVSAWKNYLAAPSNMDKRRRFEAAYDGYRQMIITRGALHEALQAGEVDSLALTWEVKAVTQTSEKKIVADTIAENP